MVERSTERVALERTRPDVIATLVAETIGVDAPNDSTFARAAEARREEAVSALDMISEHYNSTMLGDVACLAYDGVYRDSSALPAREYRMLKGYVCPAGAGAVQFELAVHSASRTPPEAEELLSVADTFFRSATFTREARR